VGLGSPKPGGASARPLRSLSLHQNQLTGPLPTNLNWRHMWYLDLSNNQLAGTFPDDWVNGNSKMLALRHLYLDDNLFYGTLPTNTMTIGMGRLEQLLIGSNQFSGTMPGNYQYLNWLQQLEIQHNNFTFLTPDTCQLSVWLSGEMVNFRADCKICSCPFFCSPSKCY